MVILPIKHSSIFFAKQLNMTLLSKKNSQKWTINELPVANKIFIGKNFAFYFKIEWCPRN